jgi:hypothetical protein
MTNRQVLDGIGLVVPYIVIQWGFCAAPPGSACA